MRIKTFLKYLCLCIGAVMAYAVVIAVSLLLGMAGGMIFLICTPILSFWYGVVSYNLTKKVIIPFLLIYIFTGSFLSLNWTYISLFALIYPCIKLLARGFSKITARIKEEKFEFIKQNSDICIIFALIILAFVCRVCGFEFTNKSSSIRTVLSTHLFGYTPYLCAWFGYSLLKAERKRSIIAFSFVPVNLLLYVIEFIIYGRKYMLSGEFCNWMIVIVLAEFAICLVSYVVAKRRLFKITPHEAQ